MNDRLGANYLGNFRCEFLVWAPHAAKVDVHILKPEDRTIRLKKLKNGYHRIIAEGISPGSLYQYRLDGKIELPDPASRFQPSGVHGPSQVMDNSFLWEESKWSGIPLHDYIIYEIHTGTFTKEGTFDSVILRLDYLKDLGITALELMPVAQFPGRRNWGYDGVYPFAIQNSYGGPDALKRLVNACHQKGMAVILDVVYNHLGPEGNYLGQFAPYFTERYNTPWGQALNFDGPYSDDVRRYFIENALYWTIDCHIDALRLDAVHAILDHSPYPFLQELTDSVHRVSEKLGRYIYLFPESADNDKRLVGIPASGGYGMDAQWNDDFHHCIHVLLTGETSGYYLDYGDPKYIEKAFKEGFVYSGQYSEFHRRRHGSSSVTIPAHRFIVCSQNHDQIGNRMMGDRLAHLIPFEALKLAAGLVILSPFIPLLFMGEEYGESAPFLYFVDHSDKELINAVRKGRKEEFSSFNWKGEPPDPQDKSTFNRSVLKNNIQFGNDNNSLLKFYKDIIRLRKSTPSLSNMSKECMEIDLDVKQQSISLKRWDKDDQTLIIGNFSNSIKDIQVNFPYGEWRKILDSADRQYGGPGSSIPANLNSPGKMSLDVPPLSIIALSNTGES